MTALLDWFTGTFERTEQVQALEPRVWAQLEGGKTFSFQGYKGVSMNGLVYAVSWDGKRALVQGSGYEASGAAALFAVLAKEGASVSRIDVQVTFEHHNADGLIAMMQPSKLYQAYRIQRIDDRGSTLYIGAPRSRVRMRIYNKTAESGMRPESGMEYVRIEVQARDAYADRAWKLFREDKLDSWMNHWAAKMLSDVDQETIACYISTSDATSITSLKEDLESSTDRRKLWFETTVVPAMKRVLLVDPDYLQVMIGLLRDRPNNGISDDENPYF